MSKTYLGCPSAGAVAWIKARSQPAGHEETWYKYNGDTEWRTVMLGGTIALIDDMGEPTGQIDNPSNIVAIEIGTGTQANPVTSIGEYAFYYCGDLTSVIIPDNVTSIGEYAFYGCIGLTGVTIPNSVTSIGEYAFYGCYGLTDVIIPNSVTSIGEGAFYDCDSLTSVTFPNGVTNIESYAFYGCSGLTSVTIPDSVTSIGYDAFSGCNGLMSVTITANGGNANNVKQMMISAGVSSSITWNMPN